MATQKFERDVISAADLKGYDVCASAQYADSCGPWIEVLLLSNNSSCYLLTRRAEFSGNAEILQTFFYGDLDEEQLIDCYKRALRALTAEATK